MNTMHHSLTDLLYMMGWSAKPIFGWTLLMLVTACFAVVKRFPPSKCWAYLIAAFLPACWGVGGTVAGAMSAFATLRTFGAGDPAKFHGALWEISPPSQQAFSARRC